MGARNVNPLADTVIVYLSTFADVAEEAADVMNGIY